MNNTFRILEGHWLDVARQIPDQSIQTCVTSVPYYGLRSYNTEPQIWLGPPVATGRKGRTRIPACAQGRDLHQWESIKQYKDSWRRGERSAGFHSDVRKAERCPACDECAKLAYSDATTPGFFYDKCETHRTMGRDDGHATQARSQEELLKGRWTSTEYCTGCNAWRGELGQEPSPALYVAHLVQVFAEVWRVLRPDGSLYVNIGDAHYNYRPGRSESDYKRVQGYNRETKSGNRDLPPVGSNRGYKIDGLKEKDLIGLPWLLAFAMRSAGWYWRSEIIWEKPNPLSESVLDRPTKNHEPILLFTKSEKYFYDKWAITEPPTGNAHPRLAKNGNASMGTKKLSPESRNNDSWRFGTAGTICPGGRNKRTVWKMNVQGYQEDAHYAAYPEALPEICIKAGSSEVGCCGSCGAPWSRIVLKPEKSSYDNETLESRWRGAAAERGIDIDSATTDESITLGWQRNCKCYAGAPTPCSVLDPFGGRGTTAVVAIRFGRNAITAELQSKYVPMIRKNVRQEAPLWITEVK